MRRLQCSREGLQRCVRRKPPLTREVVAGLGLPTKCRRVWGIQVWKVRNGEANMMGVIDIKDNDTATMTMVTDVREAFSDSDVESDRRS